MPCRRQTRVIPACRWAWRRLPRCCGAGTSDTTRRTRSGPTATASCSRAGTLGLGKLVAFYDDNGISIDGRVEGWFTDDTPKRFEGYGWHVLPSVDGHASEEVHRAIVAARAVADRPTLICCKTIIAKGSPGKAGTHEAHGAALGDKEVAATRAAIGWVYPPFEIPADVYQAWDARDQGTVAEAIWRRKFAEY